MLNFHFPLFISLSSFLFADIPADWYVNPENYEHVFTITAQLSVHDTLNHDSTKTVAAFIGDECRGVNNSVPVGDNWLIFLMVYGNTGDSEIQFKYYDGVLDSVFNIEEMLVFNPGGSEGTPDFPYVFHGEGINLAPVADAGLDLVVGEQEWVTLDGTGSYDLDNDELAFSWSAPEEIELDDLTSPTPSFMTPDVDALTHYQIFLTVSDGVNISSPDTIVVTVLNNLAINIETSPFEFKLYKPYPNPFNPTTTIRFDFGLETQYTAVLQIFDINGSLVETLFIGKLSTGNHSIRWDASNQPSGVYFVQLVSGSLSQTQKLILMK